MNKIIKEAAVLTIITLVAGLLLGIVYEITKEPIAKQEERAKQESYLAVFDNASQFIEIDVNLEDINNLIAEKGYGNDILNEILIAADGDGNTLGYVMQITSKEGYSKEIIFVLGIQLDGTINGIELLSISETAGLGMKAKEAAFKDQFSNKNVELFVYTKDGAAAENEVDVISGATITTNAMVNGVNGGICVFQSIQEGEIINE